jgi:hypothetical protein
VARKVERFSFPLFIHTGLCPPPAWYNPGISRPETPLKD